MTDGTIGKNNAFFRQLLYIGILITIGLVIFTQLQFFVGSFLGAITMYVVLRTVLFRLTERWNWKPWVASLMLVLATTLLLSGAEEDDALILVARRIREVAHAEGIVLRSRGQRRCGRIGGIFGGGVVAARSGEQRNDQQKQ